MNSRFGLIVLKNAVIDAEWCCTRFEPKRVIWFPPLGGGDRLWFGDELGQLAQVLGDGCEVEFVAGATGPAQPQPVEPQNAFECANSISTFFR